MLQTMLNMQEELQRELAKEVKGNRDPMTLLTVGEIYEYLRDNKIALDDEFREVIDALPGTNLPEKQRSGVWKKWKANHAELSEKRMTQLTPEEVHNLMEEFVDLFHFVMNMMLALGINADMLYSIYCQKHAVNAERYRSKY